MTDGLTLKYMIENHGYSVEEFAEMIDLTKQSMYQKLRNQRGFNQKQIAEISKLLDLSAEETKKIFFAIDVDETSQNN